MWKLKILHNYTEYETIYDYFGYLFKMYTDYWKVKLYKWFSHAIEKQDGSDNTFLAKDSEKKFTMLINN